MSEPEGMEKENADLRAENKRLRVIKSEAVKSFDQAGRELEACAAERDQLKAQLAERGERQTDVVCVECGSSFTNYDEPCHGCYTKLKAKLEQESKTGPVSTGRAGAGSLKVPWSIMERAYGGYSAKHGTDQSLERICQRGGFGESEMDEFAPGWREEMSEITRLKAKLAEAEELQHHIAKTASDCGVAHDNDFDAAETLDRIAEFYNDLKAQLAEERALKEKIWGCLTPEKRYELNTEWMRGQSHEQ